MSLTTTDRPTIAQVGDALTAGIEHDLRRRRRPVRRVALALAALVVIGTGTAAAAGVFSPREVAAGMPAGAVMFTDTHPRCTADGDAFACTLERAPSGDAADGLSDFMGTKEILVVEGKVAGGCIGTDSAGLSWTCYIGQDAVDHEIITQDFLGEPAGPGRG